MNPHTGIPITKLISDLTRTYLRNFAAVLQGLHGPQTMSRFQWRPIVATFTASRSFYQSPSPNNRRSTAEKPLLASSIWASDACANESASSALMDTRESGGLVKVQPRASR
jgi:hypothetical protein